MDLSQLQQFLSIGWQVILIIGIPLSVYKIYVRDQKDDGTKFSGLDTEVKLLRTELAAEIKRLTQEFNVIKLNDLHTITEKQKDQDSQIGKLTIAVSQLTTIIDERVPRKTVEKVA